MLAELLAALVLLQQPERYPNNDAKQRYPWWTEPADPRPMDTKPGVSTPVISVNPKNNAVAMAWSQGGYIHYTTNAWERRQANGWAKPVEVPGQRLEVLNPHTNVDIAYDSNGNLHFVWQEWDWFYEPTQKTYAVINLWYARLNENGTWVNGYRWLYGFQFVDGEAMRLPVTNYEWPSIAIDKGNNLHVAMIRREFRPNQNNDVEERRSIAYSLNLSAPEEITGSSGFVAVDYSAPWIDSITERHHGPRIAIAHEGTTPVPHVVWLHAYKPGVFAWQSYAMHAVRYGGWTMTPLSVNGERAMAVDVHAGGPDGRAHAVYDAPGAVKYRARSTGSGGAWGSPETASTQAGELPRVLVDSRNNPHVIWRQPGVNTKACYAEKVKNTTWARQEPLETLGRMQWTLELAINANDGMHAVTGQPAGRNYAPVEIYYDPDELDFVDVSDAGAGGPAWYFKTLEANQGAQDAPLIVGAGAGASVNVATGGLSHGVSLFAAKGHAFPASMLLSYSSLEWDRGVMAPGWSHGYHLTLTDHMTGEDEPDDRVTVQLGDGRTVYFKWNDEHRTLLAMDEFGFFAKLDRNKGTRDGVSMKYLLTTKTGIQYGFDKGDKFGKLNRIVDPNNNRMRLEYVTNNSDPATMVLKQVFDGSESIGGSGRVATLNYDTKHRLTSIDHNGKNYAITYEDTPAWRVKTVALPGQTWQYTYYAADDTAGYKKINLLYQLTNPRGNRWELKYYNDNRFRSSKDPVLSTPSLDESGNPTITQHPEVEYTYTDPNFNSGGTTTLPSVAVKNRRGHSSTIEFEYKRALARTVRDPATMSVTREFDGTYRNLTKLTDREGNVTQYTYSTSEAPTWVKDNVASLMGPSANAPSGGAAASVTLARYTYTTGSDNTFRIATAEDAFGNVTRYEYNSPSKGNLTRITHPTTGGQTAETQYQNDGNGRIISVTAPEGGQTRYTYGDAQTGLPTQIHHAGRGSPEQFLYDSMGNPTQHIRPMGGITGMVYDTLYRLQSVTAPAGDEPAVTTYTYTADNQVETVTGPGTARSVMSYDELGRVTTVSQDISAGVASITRSQYDPEGNVKKSTDPRGVTSTAVVDNLGRVTSLTTPGAPGPNVVQSFTHSANGWVKSTTVGGVTAQFGLSARGGALTVTAPITGISQQTVFTEDGLVDTHLRKSGTASTGTRNRYDERRRRIGSTLLTNASSGAGLTTRYKYDRNGNMVELTDSEGRRTQHVFDAGDRNIRVLNHDGRVIGETDYDNNDNKIVIRGLHPASDQLLTLATLSYSLRDELKATVDVLGATSTNAYDALGNVKLRQKVPANGQACFVAYQYDSAGRVLREVHDPGMPTQRTTSYAYDAGGLLTQVVDPRGNPWHMKYDQAGRMSELSYPPVNGSAFVESWAYDNRGNMIRHVDLEGKIASVTYDLMNRPTLETHTKGGVKVAEFSREYDGFSNLTGLLDTISKVKVSFTTDANQPAYDALNRPTQVRWFLEWNTPAQVLWRKISYTLPDGSSAYDASGNLLRKVDPEGHVLEYTYDMYNRMTQIRRTPSGGSPSVIADLSYHVSGYLRDMSLQGGIRHSYHYDARGLTTAVETTKPDGSVLSRFDYDYDLRGRRTKSRLQHLSTEITYDYDCHDRLVREFWSGNGTPPAGLCVIVSQPLTRGNQAVPASAPSGAGAKLTPSLVPSYEAHFVYDAVGNRTQKRVKLNGGTEVVTDCVYDTQNRLSTETTGTTTTTYSYDRNGNQITRLQGTTEERFAYDFANRLVGYDKGPLAAPTTSFMYRSGPDGHRLAKINLLGTSANEEWFFPEGSETIADYSRTSGALGYQLLRTYAGPRSIDSKLARVDASAPEKIYYYLGDALGTVQRLVSSAGVVEREELRTAWGERLPSFTPDVSPPDRHGFTQREHDDESGLTHFRARAYDARLGRFIENDPIRDNRWTKHFAYASNNPLGRLDPYGTDDYPVDTSRGAYREASSEEVELRSYYMKMGVMINRLGVESGKSKYWVEVNQPSHEDQLKWAEHFVHQEEVIAQNMAEHRATSAAAAKASWELTLGHLTVGQRVAKYLSNMNHPTFRNWWEQDSAAQAHYKDTIDSGLTFFGTLYGLSVPAPGSGMTSVGKEGTRRLALFLRARSSLGSMGGRTLYGHAEYVVADAAKAARVKHGLLEFWKKHSKGARIKFVDSNRVPGAQIDTVTGDILVNKSVVDNYPHLAEGYLMEELQHFHQLVQNNLFGKTLSAAQNKTLEAEVVGRILKSGFDKFNPR